MSRKAKSEFDREVEGIRLAKLILDSITANGLEAVRGSVFGGTMDTLVVVATGWAVPHMVEIVNQFKVEIAKGVESPKKGK